MDRFRKFGEHMVDYDAIHAEILEDEEYEECENLAEKLELYKKEFIEFDVDKSGDLDQKELKKLMEKLGDPKTQLELKKMIIEVDTRNSGTIDYADFLKCLVSRKPSILKVCLLSEFMRRERARESK